LQRQKGRLFNNAPVNFAFFFGRNESEKPARRSF